MRPQLTRLQQSIAAPDTEDSPQSFSYPTSAIGGPPDYGRKTWSAPNKDPFGGGGGGGLEDPFQRRSGQGAGRSANGGAGGGYTPSFGVDQQRAGRARRGGGGGDPPQVDRRSYLHELSEQVEEQRRRRAREAAEAGTDWWEKKKLPAEAEYRAPHPNQVSQRGAAKYRCNIS